MPARRRPHRPSSRAFNLSFLDLLSAMRQYRCLPTDI
jgi:hypothetical protein